MVTSPMKHSEPIPPARELPSPVCGGTRYPCCRWSRVGQRLIRKAFRKSNRRYCRDVLRDTDGVQD